MVKRSKSDYVIRSVAHALDVLEQFRGDTDELGVTELSKRLKLHKNNVFRILATLESRGYIEQNKATENYRLGLKVLELGQVFIRQMGLLRHAHPVLQEMVAKCNENAYVTVLRGDEVVYLDGVEANQTIRVVSRVGSHLPAYCTASGKVQLAYLSEGELEQHLPRELRRYTKNTITDIENLKEALRKIRQQGYAIDNEEYEEGVSCLSYPIRDYTRKVVGSITLSWPVWRVNEERVRNELIPVIVSAGKELCRKLGYEITEDTSP